MSDINKTIDKRDLSVLIEGDSLILEEFEIGGIIKNVGTIKFHESITPEVLILQGVFSKLTKDGAIKSIAYLNSIIEKIK